MQLLNGQFYQFHRDRIVSRPGAEPRTLSSVEVGPGIPNEKQAIRQVRLGMDVYTPRPADAYGLATKAYTKTPLHEDAHEDGFFAHYHPGGVHARRFEVRIGRPRAEDGPGHVFYGERK